MTVLTIQIGQCGNQLGFEFFDIIYNYINSSKNENFKNMLIDMYFDEEYKYNNNIFPIIEYEENKSRKGFMNEQNNIVCLNNYVARCILIDMEPKVIEKCLHSNLLEKNVNDNYSNKKKKKHYNEEKNNDDDKNQKYVCGLDEYYEPTNNFLKVFNKNGKKGIDEQHNWNDKNVYDNSYSDENIKNKVKKRSNDYFTNEWKYNNNNFIYGLNGSGNNWSYGFNVHAKNICEHFLNLINKELEKNESKENIDNILLFHSLAGGSGSGISSYISYLLKDEFPKINLFNICVLPYMFGEISVQSLNSVLCLSSLYDVSDCLILFENDKFELMCKRINNENINTNEINKYISLFLASTIGLPIDFTNLKNGNNYKYSNFMNYILSDLCCHPNYKLLSTRYLPQVFKENMKFEQNSFNMLLKRMHKMVIKGSILDSDVTNTKSSITECSNLDNYFAHLSSRSINNKKLFSKNINIPIYLNESISNSYVNHECNSIFLKRNQKNYSSKKQTYHHLKNPTEIVPSSNFIHNNVIFSSKMIMRGEVNENINFDLFKNHVLYNNKSLNPMEIYIDENKQFNYNSISMISNCLTPIPAIKKFLQNAKMLYSANAYIYQYNNYGVTHDQIHNSLMAVEQIINSYENLSSE
ncbi:delta tubulin, putative [Plasmodium gallinaceum]|uniref:Tubulin delta chain n=1 Tax=Plasmodium gallinaceum TaxID=5849 RepID=A0A1J1GXB4_PLAGA|nr:delta tubulin, putative [Plasmodium gallinaceum]CRG96888.1 delta tubulin, putative [Plasmodium gallinaceum]